MSNTDKTDNNRARARETERIFEELHHTERILDELHHLGRDNNRARERETERILEELARLLVLQMSEELDLDDPDDRRVYNHSVDLHAHIRETLAYARRQNDKAKTKAKAQEGGEG